MYNPKLRILIIDDTVYELAIKEDRQRSSPRFYTFFNGLVKEGATYQLTIHLAAKVPSYNKKNNKLYYKERENILEIDINDIRDEVIHGRKLEKNPEISKYDLLVLDLDGVENDDTESWSVNKSTLKDIEAKLGRDCHNTQENVNRLNSHFPGASWYLKNIRHRYLNTFEQVFVISNYDPKSDKDEWGGEREEKEKALSSLELYLNEFCDPFVRWEGFPPTRKYSALDADDLERAAKVAGQMLSDRISGLDYLPRGREVESASFHDLPVLIIGENSTGRDRIAEGVARRWLHRRADQHNLKPSELPRSSIIVDCAGLSPEDAHTELFGQIRRDPNSKHGHFELGAILNSIGLANPRTEDSPDTASCEGEDREEVWASVLSQPVYAPQGDKIDRFDKSNHSVPSLIPDYSQTPTPGHVRPEPDARVGPDAGWGVIYLREFHYLSRSVQDALLRFLRTELIEPLGFSGTIKVPQVRVIASSSHPRVGEALGVKPPLWRSLPALDEQPVSEDLLLALKGRIIRSESVTETNVRGVIQRELRERGEDIEWTPSAYKEVGHKLEKINPEKRSDDEAIPLFGQHQEVRRLITLAHAFVAERETRGSRSAPEKVTDTVIKRVWSEAVVPGYSGAPIAWDKEDFMAAIDKDSPAAWAFFRGVTEKLDQYWEYSNLKDKIDSVIEENKEELKHRGEVVQNPLGPHGDKLSNRVDKWWNDNNLDDSGYYPDIPKGEEKVGIIKKSR